MAVEVDDADDDADANDDDKAPAPLLLLLLCSSPPSVFPASPPPKGHERLANGGCDPFVIILNVGRERRASTAASSGCKGDCVDGGDIKSNASLIDDGENSSP